MIWLGWTVLLGGIIGVLGYQRYQARKAAVKWMKAADWWRWQAMSGGRQEPPDWPRETKKHRGLRRYAAREEADDERSE